MKGIGYIWAEVLCHEQGQQIGRTMLTLEQWALMVQDARRPSYYYNLPLGKIL